MNKILLTCCLSVCYLNQGFSGGEKKKSEILQLAVLNPKTAILDETDSGLDIDGIRTVSEGINAAIRGSGSGTLVITHYSRILEHINPDKVHVLSVAYLRTKKWVSLTVAQ